MKTARHIILLVIVLSFAGCGGDNENGNTTKAEISSAEVSGVAEISFEHTIHDFGEVVEGEKVGCIFKYTNTGSSNLIIKKATGSCGCTVPKWNREPTPPGGSGRLEVIFDSSGRRGKQNKSISVSSNGSNNVTVLMIKAEIVRRES